MQVYAHQNAPQYDDSLIIEMYSDKEFNIFYDQQLLDSIMLTYKNYVIKSAAIYIFRNINDNEFPYWGMCAIV